MPVAFIPNPDFEDDLSASPEAKDAIKAFVKTTAENAIAIGESIARTGAYAASIEYTETEVYSTDPGAPFIEYGSVHNKPMAPLRRAVEETEARPPRTP